LPTWLLVILFGLGGFLAGAAGTILLLRERLAERTRARAAPPSPLAATPPPIEEAPPAAESTAQGHGIVALISGAIRDPIARLRREPSCPQDALEALERLAWQTRMLTAAPLPMHAHPTSPITLLEEAAQQVDLLRLGKVPASWTLRSRQPVHVAPKRARHAFRELLRTAAESAGEGGRVGVRVLPGRDSRFPVEVEIEVGNRGAEPDPLAVLVVRRILEGEGARFEVEGPLARVRLRSDGPKPPQTDSNR
jgi:signal transduction histidine kinase